MPPLRPNHLSPRPPLPPPPCLLPQRMLTMTLPPTADPPPHHSPQQPQLGAPSATPILCVSQHILKFFNALASRYNPSIDPPLPFQVDPIRSAMSNRSSSRSTLESLRHSLPVYSFRHSHAHTRLHRVTMCSFRQQLLDTIAANQVVLLVGSPLYFVALFCGPVKIVFVDTALLLLQAKPAAVHLHPASLLKHFNFCLSRLHVHTCSHCTSHTHAYLTQLLSSIPGKTTQLPQYVHLQSNNRSNVYCSACRCSLSHATLLFQVHPRVCCRYQQVPSNNRSLPQ